MDTKYKLHGAFSWCELLTTDVAGAKRFYSKLFNWTLEPAPGIEYTLVKYGCEQMGGIMAIKAAYVPQCARQTGCSEEQVRPVPT